MYETTPETDRALRDLLRLLIAECQEKILGLNSVQVHLQKNQDFALDVLRNHCKDLAKKGVHKYWCQECLQYIKRLYSNRCLQNHPLDDLPCLLGLLM